MKYFKTMILVMLGFVLGLAATSLQRPHENAETKETDVLRASLEQAEQAAEKALVQRNRLKDEVDRLRASTQEVHGLRAEVSRLTRELTENRAVQEQVARTAKKADLSREVPVKLKAANEAGPVPVESAPLAVQTALYRELGNRPMNAVLGSSIDKTGRMTYGFKGQTSDQRGIAVRFAEDGSVLERSTDIATDTVPPQVQAPAAQVFGTLPISTAREIVAGDNLIYELSAKGPESGMQAMVRNDGTILSYSAKLRQPEREQGKQKR